MSSFEAKKTTKMQMVTREEPVDYVSITMPLDSAEELAFLLGSIGGPPQGNFRESTSQPLYYALEKAGVCLNWDDDEKMQEFKNRFLALYCDIIGRW